jgi:hypothetical protein
MLHLFDAPPNKRMHATRDTSDVINLHLAGGRVMRGVMLLLIVKGGSMGKLRDALKHHLGEVFRELRVRVIIYLTQRAVLIHMLRVRG